MSMVITAIKVQLLVFTLDACLAQRQGETASRTLSAGKIIYIQYRAAKGIYKTIKPQQ